MPCTAAPTPTVRLERESRVLVRHLTRAIRAANRVRRTARLAEQFEDDPGALVAVGLADLPSVVWQLRIAHSLVSTSLPPQ
jgi:hypothetical protein